MGLRRVRGGMGRDKVSEYKNIDYGEIRPQRLFNNATSQPIS